MKTINDLFVGLTPEQIFKLGEVAGAYSQRKFCREKAKQALADYELAQKEYPGHMIDTVADFHERVRRDYELRHQEAVGRKISAEKNFNRSRHKAREVGIQDQVLEELVDILSKML